METNDSRILTADDVICTNISKLAADKFLQQEVTPKNAVLRPTQYDVGVDNNDFTSVSFAQVKSSIKKQIGQSRKGEQ